MRVTRRFPAWIVLATTCGCSGEAGPPAGAGDGGAIGAAIEGTCETEGLDGGAGAVPIHSSGAVDYLRHVGCGKDFQALASDPIDSTLPGARSAKVVYDTAQADGALYFQNSVLYPIHYDFVSTHLSGNGLPVVPQLAGFNKT